MDNIQIFNNPDFGEIRTIMIDGEPWFVGRDVAMALGYEKQRNAIQKHVDADDALKWGIEDALGRKQETTIINESGLYSLIFGSKLESAKKFKRWVTSEVLPSVRKTGQFGQARLPMSIPEQIQLLAQGNVTANKRIDRAEMRIRDLEDTMTLDYGQQAVLGQTVNKTVLNHLGGKESPAYKPIGRKVFAECNSDLKHYFKVNARANVPKKRYEEAVVYAENWKPCTNTVMLINEYNSQNKLDI